MGAATSGMDPTDNWSSASAPAKAGADFSYDAKYSFKMGKGLLISCTPSPIYKAIEGSLRKTGCQYHIIRVTGFVKWQADGAVGAAGPTHAQLGLRRYLQDQFSLTSRDPWGKPVYFPLAVFADACPSPETTAEFDFEAEKNDPSNPFWEAGNKSKCDDWVSAGFTRL